MYSIEKTHVTKVMSFSVGTRRCRSSAEASPRSIEIYHGNDR